MEAYATETVYRRLRVWLTRSSQNESNQPGVAMHLGRLLTALFLLATPLAAGAADWKPAATPLMTKWGKQVSPDNAWKEYPRPQMVREGWQNLNGLWDYA